MCDRLTALSGCKKACCVIQRKPESDEEEDKSDDEEWAAPAMTVGELEAMPPGPLKALCRKRRISTSGMLEKSDLVEALAKPPSYGTCTPVGAQKLSGKDVDPKTQNPQCQLRFRHLGDKTPPGYEQATLEPQEHFQGKTFLSYSKEDTDRRVRQLSCSESGGWSCVKADRDGGVLGNDCLNLHYSSTTPPMCVHIAALVAGKPGTFAKVV